MTCGAVCLSACSHLVPIEYSKLVYPYKIKKAPVDMNIPKEGAFAAVNCVTMVKNGPNPDLAAAFVNRLLDPMEQKPPAVITPVATQPRMSSVCPKSGTGTTRPGLTTGAARSAAATGVSRVGAVIPSIVGCPS